MPHHRHPSVASEERVCRSSALQHFPESLPQSHAMRTIIECLAKHGAGFSRENTLLATSCCPDEINRDLDIQARQIGRAFSMGGLAGFPFVGKTGFGAFMHHVQDNGCMLVICASHVGVDPQGVVGKVHRHGMKAETTACGAAVAAYNFCDTHSSEVDKIANGDSDIYPGFKDPLDSQQNHIQKFVASKYKAIKESGQDPMAELARVCSAKIREELEEIIPKDLEFPLFVLQGIQINFEGRDAGEDYLCPISFTCRHEGKETDLMAAFQA